LRLPEPWLTLFSLDLVRLPRWITKFIFKGAAVDSQQQYDRERAKLPEHIVGAVRIYGHPPFVSQVTEALSQLQQAYPYGYSLVQRYIRGIIQSDFRRQTGHPIQVVFRSCTPEGILPFAPNRFAANLVRYAVVFRKQLAFGLARSRKSEYQSLNRELHAMRLLQCDPRYFHRPTNLILNLEREKI
jgi:hypothetical protein